MPGRLDEVQCKTQEQDFCCGTQEEAAIEYPEGIFTE